MTNTRLALVSWRRKWLTLLLSCASSPYQRARGEIESNRVTIGWHEERRGVVSWDKQGGILNKKADCGFSPFILRSGKPTSCRSVAPKFKRSQRFCGSSS